MSGRSLEKFQAVSSFTVPRWDGRRHSRRTYRYRNDVSLRDTADSLHVNWIEMTETTEAQKVLFHTALITSYRRSPPKTPPPDPALIIT